MGWMTTVQEWGKSLNNNWMPTVREWGKSLSDKAAVVSNAVAALNNNLTIKKVAKGIGSSTRKVFSYGFKQSAGLFDLVSETTNPNVQSIYTDMAYILYKNVTPWVLASYLNSLIVTQLQEMTDPENDQSISVNTALTLMVGAINCLTFMYQAKKSAETTINMLILMAKASNQFSQAGEELQGSTFKVFSNPTPEGELKQVTICEQENCNFLRKFKGGIENSVNYWAIRGLLWGISFIPYVGKPLSAVLLILYDGQFILAMAMPDHCNRHITAYLEQNWELAASLGLGSRAINFAFVEGVFYLTGIPREHYQDVLQKFAILMQIGTATHMSLPAPVKKSSRELLDPLSIFSRGVDFVFELMTAGAKKKVPEMLKGQKSDFDWPNSIKIAQDCWNNPYLQKPKQYLLPSMLVSEEKFTNDPMIKPCWNAILQSTESVTHVIIDIRENKLVQMASSVPNASASVLQKLKNLPPFVTVFALASLYTPPLMKIVYLINFKITGKKPEELKPIVPVDDNRLRVIESAAASDLAANSEQQSATPLPPSTELKPQVPEALIEDLKPCPLAISAKALRHVGAFSQYDLADFKSDSNTTNSNFKELSQSREASFF